eukprot:g34757.t1
MGDWPCRPTQSGIGDPDREEVWEGDGDGHLEVGLSGEVELTPMTGTGERTLGLGKGIGLRTPTECLRRGEIGAELGVVAPGDACNRPALGGRPSEWALLEQAGSLGLVSGTWNDVERRILSGMQMAGTGNVTSGLAPERSDRRETEAWSRRPTERREGDGWAVWVGRARGAAPRGGFEDCSSCLMAEGDGDLPRRLTHGGSEQQNSDTAHASETPGLGRTASCGAPQAGQDSDRATETPPNRPVGLSAEPAFAAQPPWSVFSASATPPTSLGLEISSWGLQGRADGGRGSPGVCDGGACVFVGRVPVGGDLSSATSNQSETGICFPYLTRDRDGMCSFEPCDTGLERPEVGEDALGPVWDGGGPGLVARAGRGLCGTCPRLSELEVGGFRLGFGNRELDNVFLGIEDRDWILNDQMC